MDQIHLWFAFSHLLAGLVSSLLLLCLLSFSFALHGPASSLIEARLFSSLFHPNSYAGWASFLNQLLPRAQTSFINENTHMARDPGFFFFFGLLFSLCWAGPSFLF